MASCRCLTEAVIAWIISGSLRAPRFSTSRFLTTAASRRSTETRSLSPDRSAVFKSSVRRPLRSTALLLHQAQSLHRLLARRQHLLLPADARLLVVLSLAKLGQDTRLLALLLEAA